MQGIVDKDEMKRRTKRFALDALDLCRTLPRTDEARVISRQLIRSATSVGANYRAVCLAKSRADFVSKMAIVLEEVDESEYWLELLEDGHICRSPEVARLMKEATELTSVAAASVITARQRQDAQVAATKP